MLGNVMEWVEDCDGAYKDASVEGSSATSNDCEKLNTRGGFWLDGPTWVRSAFRQPLPPKVAVYTLGFRVAGEVPRGVDDWSTCSAQFTLRGTRSWPF